MRGVVAGRSGDITQVLTKGASWRPPLNKKNKLAASCTQGDARGRNTRHLFIILESAFMEEPAPIMRGTPFLASRQL